MEKKKHIIINIVIITVLLSTTLLFVSMYRDYKKELENQDVRQKETQITIEDEGKKPKTE